MELDDFDNDPGVWWTVTVILVVVFGIVLLLGAK